MLTYIIQTREYEYYCGKTKYLDKRINQHLSEKKPHWFAYKNRKNIRMIVYLQGDFEKKIKKFGIKNLFCFMENYSLKKVPQPP